MAECAKGDRGVANIRLVGEHDLQDGDVVDDGRRDGGDEQEDGCGKQQEGAHMVEDACLGHSEDEMRWCCSVGIVGQEWRSAKIAGRRAHVESQRR